ncbi:MoaD/ThiS family protein [Qipengyuania sp. XHP0207]|uniref:MoaD/ThiS family protein n=1 Tax=Qipengyuania sp. XHP0207 TaxID=3038078 RepID=UPI00241F9DAA|nr:MoaD/ThiS family protein [Qipengyuania sp. XHP0207]MDG5748764.1 MoaD/ThiS family protein [Qipengyuania sp. XHP0207]
MAVRILLLGPLRDLAERQEIKTNGPLDWPGLLEAVGPQVAAQLADEKVNVACAGKVLADRTSLVAQDGEEVALLPPVSGG